ncbi:MAG TPA: helix-turn-helix domain-containing protein [Solirubrobacteraceae bacterium]|nr:helix-turn-helix domain-containing protein [Solirubrobacteraceae bacterium]
MARRRAGLTQRELAGRVECRQATIARWERGDRQPSYEDVQAVASVCGLQLDAHLAPEDRSWWPQIAMQLDCTPVQRVRRLTPPGAFDVVPILERLAENQASVIVIGEVAGALDGWPLVLGGDTVEVCAEGDGLGETEGVVVTEIPPGTTGFADLARDAGTVEIDGSGVRVAGLRDLLRIADASPHSDSRRQALAYGAVLDVQRARLKASAADDRSDEEKIQAWLSEQILVA